MLSRGFDTTTDVKPKSARKAEDSILEVMETMVEEFDGELLPSWGLS